MNDYETVKLGNGRIHAERSIFWFIQEKKTVVVFGEKEALVQDSQGRTTHIAPLIEGSYELAIACPAKISSQMTHRGEQQQDLQVQKE